MQDKENNIDNQNIKDSFLNDEIIEDEKELLVEQESEFSKIDNTNTLNNNTEELITVRPVKFQAFEKEGIISAIKKNLDIMQDVMMRVSVEIGKTKSSIREVMELTQGSIVELDKIAGEQVEVYVNEKLVARGEVIVIEDKFGVRVTTTSLPKAPGEI